MWFALQLHDVKAGGATVFPEVSVRVPVIKVLFANEAIVSHRNPSLTSKFPFLFYLHNSGCTFSLIRPLLSGQCIRCYTFRLDNQNILL